jgi:hypothetical protein
MSQGDSKTKKRAQLDPKLQKELEEKSKSYRERALKMYPWVCGVCCREFTGKNVKELTVHHKDHDHDNNPPDGSNWELLCIYCHDNEHARHLVSTATTGEVVEEEREKTTFKAFEGLADLMKKKSDKE